MIELVMVKRGCSYDELFEAYCDVCKENKVLQKDFDDLDNDNLELIKRNDELKKTISELEKQIERDKELLEVKTAEVSISEDKILSCLCPYCGKIVAGKIPNGYKVNEEPLPFSSDECEEETKTELPSSPIDVASMLISILRVTCERLRNICLFTAIILMRIAIRKVNGNGRAVNGRSNIRSYLDNYKNSNFSTFAL